MYEIWQTEFSAYKLEFDLACDINMPSYTYTCMSNVLNFGRAIDHQRLKKNTWLNVRCLHYSKTCLFHH